MTSKKLAVLLWEPLVNVPESGTEYNTLAPKRTDAVLEDAIASTCYRSVSPVIRDGLCTYLDADPAPEPAADATEETIAKANANAGLGIKRKNFGTEKEPQWEKEGVFVKRAVATLMKARNETEEQVIAYLAPVVQRIASSPAAKFDPSLREGGGSGPAIGVNDRKLAKSVIEKSGLPRSAEEGGGTYPTASDIAGKLSILLAREVKVDEDDLARAIADNRKALAAKAAAEQKAALGL